MTFEARHRQEQAPRHWPQRTWARTAVKTRGTGAAEQIALARGESPNRGGRLLGTAKALMGMPHTLGALDTGQLNEERVMHVVKETACLSVEDRTAVDEELAADTGTFNGAGTRAVIAAVRVAAIRRDPRSVAQRASHAASVRRVSLRPAPDCMTYLTALLPVHEGVAVHTALTRRADSLRATGDPRSRDQIKADTLVECTTGTPGGITGIRTQPRHDRPHPPPRRLRTCPDPRLRHHPRRLRPEPDNSGKRRDGDPSESFNTWLMRLYTAPRSGDLVAMDSRGRLFPPKLRRFIQIRDDTCRTPYCDAPIRHHDHIVPWHAGGPTTLANGAGLCEACNHTKELPGWKAQPRPGLRHTIEITTPTGHTYRSTAPPLAGFRVPGTGPNGTNVP